MVVIGAPESYRLVDGAVRYPRRERALATREEADGTHELTILPAEPRSMSDRPATSVGDPQTGSAETTPSLGDPETRVFLGLGFALWFLATIAFRLAGGYLLDPTAPLVIGAVYVVTVPAMAALALALYRWRGATGWDRLRAAVALVLPGMLLDTFAMAWFEALFSNMAPDAAKYFGGLLLLAYASVLLSAFVPTRWSSVGP